MSRHDSASAAADRRITPYTLHIEQAALDDLQRRLLATRLPDQLPCPPGACGVEVSWVHSLLQRWQHGFDWRVAEATLNQFPQYMVELEGVSLHYLHVPGVGPAPTPLLLSHGWPGSVFEFCELIPRLTDPARYGGDARDAFTVVVPSLPGFGLSWKPGQRPLELEQVSSLFVCLMRDVLGYTRFGAHGGDLGAYITGRMAHDHPECLLGIHLTLLPSLLAGALSRSPTAQEQVYLDAVTRWQRNERGYAFIQGTRPQTLAYALTDSPAGLLAWIGEKYQEWSDGGVGEAIPYDHLLADVALYWLTGAIASSFWLYRGLHHGPRALPNGATIDVPMAYADFPKEILRPPRSIAERVFTDLRRWTEMPRGGHFAAVEQPGLLSHDLVQFFGSLRG